MACWIGLAASAAFAQSFDAASVKPLKLAGEGKFPRQVAFSPGSVSLRNVTLKDIIGTAYGVKDFQISGPAWLSSEAYEILAKASGPATEDELKQMLQGLLAERFRLALHREQKELPVYEMVVVKKSAALREPAKPGDPAMKIVPGGLGFQNYSMPHLAEYLSHLRSADRPVLDKTGIEGQFDFNVRLSDSDSGDVIEIKKGMERAFQDSSLALVIAAQIGLKLESKKSMHEMLVIDRVERPAEN
jgi:uncharacterized protein (TIGR03435 family)